MLLVVEKMMAVDMTIFPGIIIPEKCLARPPTRCERRCFRGLAASTGERLFSLDFGFHFPANAPGWSVVVMVVTIIRSNDVFRFAKEVKREPGLSLKLRDPDAIVALRLPMAI